MADPAGPVGATAGRGSNYRLGVDLGTTFTAAAVGDGGAPWMLGLGNRALQVPSVVYLGADGSFLIGEAAERRGTAEPDHLVREFKRRLGDQVPIMVAGTPVAPEELMGRLLAWVLARADERMGGRPGEVVLTYPANWGPFKLGLLEHVATLAGLEEWRSCPEPVAAAAQYAASVRVAVGDWLAVYDLGGGTFDACVLEKTADGFTILGTPEGVERLGGVDFDESIFTLVWNSLGERAAALNPDNEAVTIGLARLRRECVDAKEALSADVDVAVPVALPDLTTSVRVNRSEFEALIRPAVGATVSGLSRVLRSAGIEAKDLHAIVLVGGSSRIPLVGEMLQREFGVPTALDVHPKHDVALGAVRVGESRLVTGVGAAKRSRPAPDVVPAPASAGDAPVAEPAQEEEAGAEATQPSAGSLRSASQTASRRPVALIIAAAAVVAGILAGVAVANIRGGRTPPPTPSTDLSLSPSATSSTQVPSPTTTPTPTPTNSAGSTLPRSTPLPDTQLLVPVLVDGAYDIYLGDVTKKAPVRALVERPGNDGSVSLSPDRATMIYSHEGVLQVAAADGTGSRPLFSRGPKQCAESNTRPGWNRANPTQIVTGCVDANGKSGVYLITIEGKVIRKLSEGDDRVGDPGFSPDGKFVVFWANAAESGFDGGEIVVASTNGKGKPRRVTTMTDTVHDADPAWSPKGDQIAFRRRDRKNSDVYVIDADGKGQAKPLADDPDANEQDPSWSPSADQIAYKSIAETKAWPDSPLDRIWVMNRDGSKKRVLWTSGVRLRAQTAPSWSSR